MRFFNLLNLQHVALFFFPTLIFIILLAIALRGMYFKTESAERSLREIRHTFPGAVGERDGPTPLVLILIIAGFIIWALFYALSAALTGGPI